MSGNIASQSLPTEPHGRSRRLVRLVTVAAGAVLAMSVALNVSAATTSVAVQRMAAPGDHIVISGAGFAPGQAGNLTYNGGLVTTFVASSNGSYSVPFVVPDSALMDSTGRISAKTSSGVLISTTTLLIGANVSAPTLYVPDRAAPGTTFEVGGAGFAVGQTGIVTINGLTVTTFKASATGSFSVPFALPGTTTLGTGRISAKTAAKALLATTTLTVAAGVPGPSPTKPPAPNPTAKPNPTTAPTAAPTADPTAAPVADPTAAPTADPTAAPTAGPTAAPTTAPPAPTANPTLAPTPAPTNTPAPTAPPASNLPNFSHVYVIIFENKEYSSVVGSSQAPYINSLISQYGLSTNFTAERHPSEPNYIALTSGGTQGIADDGVYNLGVNNLFDQITASGRTWRAVMQGKPAGCFTGSSSGAVIDGVGKSGAYVRKHDPAISYTSISGNAAKCANITNLASFDPAAASFQFITPNMINDMHDGTVADGDNFLKAFLPKITGSTAFANSVVFVTFDEGTTAVSGGGHIMTIAITPGMTAGYKTAAAYTHYSMLRTVEQAWGLPYLGAAGSATAMAFPW
jgi:phosphatidylinositol-3-phosphatase